jgi:hypothetical protein
MLVDSAVHDSGFAAENPHRNELNEKTRARAYIDGKSTSPVTLVEYRTRPFLCYHLLFRSVLLSSRRLWPAPTTAPLAALPPVAAPIAAPFAAPLAFSPVFFSGWACVAGGGDDFAGSVCADAEGNIAPITDIAVTNPMTLSECFTWPPFGLLLFRFPRSLAACVRRGPLPRLIMTLCAGVGSLA